MTHSRFSERLSCMIITAYSAEGIAEICKKITEAGLSCPESALVGGRDHLRLIARLPEEMLISGFPQDAEVFPADENSLAKLAEHDRVIIPKNAAAVIARSSHRSGSSSHIPLEKM